MALKKGSFLKTITKMKIIFAFLLLSFASADPFDQVNWDKIKLKVKVGGKDLVEKRCTLQDRRAGKCNHLVTLSTLRKNTDFFWIAYKLNNYFVFTGFILL